MRQRHFTAARSRMMTSHGFLLGILTVCFFVGFSSVAALSPLVASLGQVYNLSRLERGIAVAAPALTGALLRIPAAYRADREGGRRTVVCLLGISALGFALLATIAALVGTIHLPRPMLLSLLVGAGAAAGAGAALFAPGATYLTYIVPFGMLGRATGLFGGLGNLGAGIAALVLPFAVLRFGLPACYACWAFVLAGLAAIVARTLPDPPYFELRRHGYQPHEARRAAAARGQECFPGDRLSLGQTARALQSPAMWLLVCTFGTTFGGFLAFSAWLPLYWIEAQGLDLGQAGAATAAFAVTASASRVLGGFAADRLGPRSTLVTGLLATTLLGLFATGLNNATAMVLVVVLLGSAMGIVNGAVFKLVPVRVPDVIGSANGLVSGLGAVPGFLLPPLFGLWVDAFGSAGHRLPFVTIALLAALCWFGQRATRSAMPTARRDRTPSRPPRSVE